MKTRHSGYILTPVLLCLAWSAAEGSLLDKLEWKAEKHFGKTSKAQVESEFGFVAEPLLTRYINEIGAKTVAVSHRGDIPYEFHVIDSGEMNAFAAPGGFVFVTRGLLEEIDSDDELACVIGHEVGHVAAHHGAKRIKKLPFIIAGLNILQGRYGEGAARIGGIALSLMQLHYSREDEYEADRLGIEYSFNSGYDPRGMKSFFAKMERKHRTGDLGRLQIALSSHPKTPARVREIEKTAQMQPTSDNLLRTAASYMSRRYYHDAADGFRAAAEADPGSIAARLGLAEALIRAGELQEARRLIGEILENDPENPIALELSRLGTLQEARTDSPGAGDEITREKLSRARNDLQNAAALAHRALTDFGKPGEKNDALIADLNKRTDNDLPGFSKTISSLAERGLAGEEIIEGASLFFSSFTSLLRRYGDFNGEMEFALRETRRRVREALYAVDGAESRRAAGFAQRMIEPAMLLPSTVGEKRGAMNSALLEAGRSYSSMRRLMSLLAAAADADQPVSMWDHNQVRSYEAEYLADHLRRLGQLERDRAEVRAAALKVRTAALNLAAALLPPHEEETFRRMLEKRFAIQADELDAAASKGLGYADAVLLKSRSVRSGTPFEELVSSARGDAADPSAVPAAQAGVEPEYDAGTAAAENLLLRLAEIDLNHLSRRPRDIRITPPEDPPGSDQTQGDTDGGADEDLDRAEELLRQGNPGESERLIFERGKRLPATARSHRLLGMVYKYQDRHAEAINEFEHCLKKNAGDVSALIATGNTFFEMEEYDRALERYNEAARLSPAYAPAHLGAGSAAAMIGRESEAEEYFRRAIEADPSMCPARNNLGILLYWQGLRGEALNQFKLSLAGCPGQREIETMVSLLER
ncbi:MAG: M48 family metalloprotease [bacterium]